MTSYFYTTKKGEVFELRMELNSHIHERKAAALKKIIASMTVGKDVSELFPDVAKCISTEGGGGGGISAVTVESNPEKGVETIIISPTHVLLISTAESPFLPFLRTWS